MVGVKKQPIKRSARTRVVRFENFSLVDRDKKGTLFGVDGRNCDCADGTIKTGLGLKNYLTPYEKTYVMESAAVRSFYLHRIKHSDGVYNNQLGYMLEDGKYYLYNHTTGAFVKTLVFGGATNVVGVINADLEVETLFIGGLGVTRYDPDRGYTRSILTKAGLANCVFHDRLFVVIEPFTVAYSKPLETLNFESTIDDSGKIHLPSAAGKIVAMKQLGNEICIFYEYGITRLIPAGSARDFKQVPLAYAGGHVLGETVCECGGKLFFLADDGVYTFDGKTLQKICQELNVKPTYSVQCGAACVGDRVLIRYADKVKGAVTLVLAADGKSGYFCSYLNGLSRTDQYAMCVAEGVVKYVDCDGDLYGGEEYCFQTECLDFGVVGKKNLKSLCFEGEGEMTVQVDDGQTIKQKAVKFIDGKAVVRMGLVGESFALRFTLKKGAIVRKLAISYTA
jgi:hypothetical protein